MMPLLDGPGVLSAMRADPKLAAVPVVMMPSSMPEQVVSARATGYVMFLRKPFSFEALVAAVEKALAVGR